jgi:hypothetical protein
LAPWDNTEPKKQQQHRGEAPLNTDTPAEDHSAEDQADETSSEGASSDPSGRRKLLRDVNGWLAAALCLPGCAVLCASFSAWSWLTMPLAGLGLVLAPLGLAVSEKRTTLEFVWTGLGTGLNVVVLFIMLFFPALLNPSWVATASPKETGTVKGKVYFEGRPVKYGKVVFAASDHATRSGPIQEDGSYAVEEITLGPARIVVASPNPRPGGSQIEAEFKELEKRSIQRKTAVNSPKDSEKWAPIPGHYADFKESGLVVEVVKGTTTHNIELKEKPKPKEKEPGSKKKKPSP